MEVFNLDIIPGKVAPVIHASQYDDGREFRANLFEGASVYTLTGAETITINVRKPDGNVVTAAVTNTADSFVEFATTEQMTACAGANLCELKFENSPVKIGSLNFILSVEADPLEGGIQSESAIHDLQAQIAAAVADQYDAAAVIFDAAPTPGHGVGFAVTSEGVAAAIPQDLDDLNDVSTNAPTTGEAIVWDGTKWTNGTVSTVGNLDDLSDVDTTGKANGDSLRYDGAEWIAQPTTVALTQAEYDALVLSGDLVPNTHYVITDAPNLNETASDIEYSSGVTVKQAIDSKANKTWEYIGKITNGDTGLDVSNKSEVLLVGFANNNTRYLSFTFPMAEIVGVATVIVIEGTGTNRYVGEIAVDNNYKFTTTQYSISGWTSMYLKVYAR